MNLKILLLSKKLKNDISNPFIAPGTFSLAGYSDNPGTFTGSLTIKNSFGSTSVPVTVEVTGSADHPPILSSVVNGASHRATALAPGEIITLRGIGIGPQLTGLRLDDQGRMEINGQPAPVLYASPEQWNVIVPYEVAERSSATVRVTTFGLPSRVWTLPVAPAAPVWLTTRAVPPFAPVTIALGLNAAPTPLSHATE